MAHLRTALQVLREHHLYTKHYKCEFWLSEVEFVGHVLIVGIEVNQVKGVVELRWERRTSVTEIWCFLRLAGY